MICLSFKVLAAREMRRLKGSISKVFELVFVASGICFGEAGDVIRKVGSFLKMANYYDIDDIIMEQQVTSRQFVSLKSKFHLLHLFKSVF